MNEQISQIYLNYKGYNGVFIVQNDHNPFLY